MAKDDKIVPDPGVSIPKNEKTVLESNTTVLDDCTTMLEAALSDAAGRTDTDTRENGIRSH